MVTRLDKIPKAGKLSIRCREKFPANFDFGQWGEVAMKKLFALFFFSSLTGLGAKADSLGTDLSSLINEKAGVVIRDTVLFGGRTDFLPNLILVPSITAIDGTNFDVLQAVPGDTPAKVRESMISALANVEIGTISIPKNQQDQIDEANKLLYDNAESKTKSNAFVKYEEFSREYTELLQQIENEENPARKTNLRNRLARVDRDWKTFGRKIEIERALELTRDIGPSNTQELLDDLLKKLEEETPPPAIEDILRTAAGTSWVQVFETGDQIEEVQIAIQVGGESVDIATGFNLLEYVVTLSSFSFDPFSHEFFSRRDWRLKDGGSFSNGVVGDNDAGEALSKYIGGVVLVSDIRLSSPNAVINIEDSANLDLDAHHAYLQSNSLKLPSYYVAGILVVDTPKIPDPLPNVEWE